MKLIFILLLFLFIQYEVNAGDVDPESEVLVQKGRYVTVTVMRGNPVKIFVANKQRVTIDNNAITLEATSGSAPLKLSRSGEYYVIDQTPEVISSPPQMIEVRTRLNKTKKSETFKFNLGKP